jgi:hypothetical protein
MNPFQSKCLKLFKTFFSENFTNYWPSVGQHLSFENVRVENLSERNLQNSGEALNAFLFNIVTKE